MATRRGARPGQAEDQGEASSSPPPSLRLSLCSLTLRLLPLQKLHPKKNQPWRLALRGSAANQAEADQLAAKLQETTLV